MDTKEISQPRYHKYLLLIDVLKCVNDVNVVNDDKKSHVH